MSLKIVRNDITRMNTEAIVNTANSQAVVGPGCDQAIYQAAGYDQLLDHRKKQIGIIPEGEVFITPGFNLMAKYIIHAVSPLFMGGEQEEEAKLRGCYQKSLKLAKSYGIRSIAFPLIASGSFAYPKEEAMRIAVDEIHAFLLGNEMDIYLVVFDNKATMLGEKIYPELEAYIDHNYVKQARQAEYGDVCYAARRLSDSPDGRYLSDDRRIGNRIERCADVVTSDVHEDYADPSFKACRPSMHMAEASMSQLPLENAPISQAPMPLDEDEAFEVLERKLQERIAHKADTFSEYLLYLIAAKGLKNADVYHRAIVDKRYFSKIKNNKDFHPEKLKALCLCVGAKLNLDETRDLLARAGYALSPADLTDIIFSFYIEQEIYDVIEIDIKLEEMGLPCIIA